MSFTPAQLADLESIRDAARRYCRGVDRLDLEVMKSAYWPDATDDHGVFVGNAWDFCAFCMRAHDGWRSTSHCISNHSVELESEGLRARGEVYVIAHLFRRDEPMLDVWHGRYLDAYEKRGDAWRIIERVCVHEGSYARSTEAGMSVDPAAFRPGDFDRRRPGRPLGP